MFYSQFILAKKGPLGTIWIAAHLERKLRRTQVAETDIGVTVDSILCPDVPIALRLSGHLLLGVVRIYSRQVNYLFNDCSETLGKIKQAFQSAKVDLPPEATTAPFHTITLPETFDFDELELVPDSENSFLHLNGKFVDQNVTTREQITLQDTVDHNPYLGSSQFGLDERFGDGNYSSLGLEFDEEFLADKVRSSAGPSTPTPLPKTEILLLLEKENTSMPLTQDDRLNMDVDPPIDCGNEITPMEIDSHCEPVKSGSDGVDPSERKENGILGRTERDSCPPPLNQGISPDPLSSHANSHTAVNDFVFDSSRHERPGHALRTHEACTPDLNQEYRPPDEPSTPALVDETPLPLCKESIMESSGGVSLSLKDHSEGISTLKTNATNSGVLVRHNVNAEDAANLPRFFNEAPERIALPAIVAGIAMPATVSGSSTQHQVDNCLVSSTGEVIQSLTSASFPGAALCQSTSNNENTRECSAQFVNVRTFSVGENTSALTTVSKNANEFSAKEGVAVVSTTCPNFPEQTFSQQSRTVVLHESPKYSGNDADPCLTTSGAAMPQFSSTSFSFDNGHQINAFNQLSSAPPQQVNALNQLSSAPSQQPGFLVSPCGPEPVRVGTESSSSRSQHPSTNTLTNAQDSSSSFAFPSTNSFPMGLSVGHQSLLSSNTVGTESSSCQQLSTLSKGANNGQDSRSLFTTPPCIDLPMASPCSQQMLVGAGSQPPSFKPFSALPNIVADGQASGASCSPSTSNNLPVAGPLSAQITASVGLEPPSFQLSNTGLDTGIGGQALRLAFASPTDTNLPSFGSYGPQNMESVGAESSKFQLSNTRLDTTDCGQSLNKSFASSTSINPPMAGLDSSQTRAGPETETGRSSKASFASPTGVNPPEIGAHSSQTVANVGSEPPSFQVHKTGLDMRTSQQGSNLCFTHSTGLNLAAVGLYSPQASISTGTEPQSLRTPHAGLNSVIVEQGSTASFTSPAGINSPSVGQYSPQTLVGFGTVIPTFQSPNADLNTKLAGQGPNTLPAGINPPSVGSYTPEILADGGTQPPRFSSHTGSSTVLGGQGPNTSFTSPTGNNSPSFVHYSSQNSVGTGSKPSSCQPSGTLLTTMTSGQISGLSFTSSIGANHQTSGVYGLQIPVGSKRPEFQPSSTLLGPPISEQASRPLSTSPTYMNLSQNARIEIHYPKENVLPYRNVEHPSVDKNLAVNNGLFLHPEAHQPVASFFSCQNPSMSPMAMSQSDASSFAGIDRLQSSMGMNQYETLRSSHNVEGRGAGFSLLQQGFTDERIPGSELDRSKFYTPCTERSMQEHLQLESTKTPISRDEATFAAGIPSVLSTPSLSSVPRDDDVLASILGQKPKDFNIISTPNAPKPLKISTATKRMKFLSRTVPKRRKVELDTVAVLHGDVIRQQLANIEDIRRERRKAPCTRREVWRFLRECEGQENFDEPTLPDLSSDMKELYHDVLHGRDSKPIPPTVAREINEACLEAELDNIEDSDLLAHYVKRIAMRDSCLSQATGINTEQVSPNADVCLSHAAGNSEDGTIRMKLGQPKHDGEEEMASQHNLIDGLIRTGDAEMPGTEKPFEPEVANKVLDGRAGLVLNGNEEQGSSCHEPQVGEDASGRDVMGARNEEQATRASDLKREPGYLGQGQGISYVSGSSEGAQPPNTSMVRGFSDAAQPQDISLVNTFQDGAQPQSTLVASGFQEGAQPQDTSLVSTFQDGAQLQNISMVGGFREGAQPQRDTSLVSSGFREGAQPQQDTSSMSSFAEHAQLEGTSLVSNFPEGARSQFTAPVNNFPEGAQPQQDTSLVSSGFREGAQPQQNTSLVSSFAEHARLEGTSLVSNFPEGARSQFIAPVSNFPEVAQPQQDTSSVSSGFREGAQPQQHTSLVSSFAEHARLEGTSLVSNFPEGARPPQFTALVSDFQKSGLPQDILLASSFPGNAQPLGMSPVSSFSTDAQPQAMPMGSTFSAVAHLQDTSMVSKFSDGTHFRQGGRPQDILPVSSFPENAQPLGASLVSSFSTDALPQAMSMGSTFSAGAHLQGTSMASKFSDGTQLQNTSQAGSFPVNAQLQYTSLVSNFAEGARLQDTLMNVQRQDTSPISSFPEGAPQDTSTVSSSSEGLCKQPVEEGTRVTIKPDTVITLQQNEPSPISSFREGALQDTSTVSSFLEGPCKQPVEEGTRVTVMPDTVITIQQNEPSSISSFPEGSLQDTLTVRSFSEGLCKQPAEEGTLVTIKPDTIITLQQNEPSPGLDLQHSFEKEVIPMSEDGTFQPPCKQSSEHNPAEMPICEAASIDKGNAKATDYGMIAPSEEGINQDGNDKEMTAAEREGDIDGVNEDNDIAYTEMDYSSDEQEITVQDESGWSTRSRNVGKYLKTLFQDMESGSKRLGPKKILGLDRLLARRTRREAARMFFETLVLKTKDYIHVEQDVAYQDILLYPNSKLLKAEF